MAYGLTDYWGAAKLTTEELPSMWNHSEYFDHYDHRTVIRVILTRDVCVHLKLSSLGAWSCYLYIYRVNKDDDIHK